MDDATMRATIFAVLRSIAPEATEGGIAPDRPLREEVDLDSIDFLNFLVGLKARLGIDVPEADYAKLVTLDDLVRYLQARAPAGAGEGLNARAAPS